MEENTMSRKKGSLNEKTIKLLKEYVEKEKDKPKK
jgi:hypothetical protein